MPCRVHRRAVALVVGAGSVSRSVCADRERRTGRAAGSPVVAAQCRPCSVCRCRSCPRSCDPTPERCRTLPAGRRDERGSVSWSSPRPRCRLRTVSSASWSVLRWNCSSRLSRSRPIRFCTLLVTSVVLMSSRNGCRCQPARKTGWVGVALPECGGPCKVASSAIAGLPARRTRAVARSACDVSPLASWLVRNSG